LEIESRADRLSCGVEDREDLVAANLDDGSGSRLDPLGRDRNESLGQRRRRFIALGVAEARVPAQICDQERADHGRGLARSGRSQWPGIGVHRARSPSVEGQVAGLSPRPA
jgi:hypothetical protein